MARGVVSRLEIRETDVGSLAIKLVDRRVDGDK